jgi:hypothetical protein
MEPVSSVLFSLYRGTPQHDEWVLACLEGAWAGIVGERLAAVCRPHSFKESSLVIAVADASWEKALKGLKKEITQKLRSATFGEVRSVSLKRNS